MRDVRGIECESGRLIGASYGRYSRYEMKRLYDDGFGPVWIYQDASGLLALVRARTWEDAWSICEDCILDDADPEDAERYWADESGDVEGIGSRPNGGQTAEYPWAQTPFYQEDLNGSRLELLTYADMETHGISLLWQSWAD